MDITFSSLIMAAVLSNISIGYMVAHGARINLADNTLRDVSAGSLYGSVIFAALALFN